MLSKQVTILKLNALASSSKESEKNKGALNNNQCTAKKSGKNLFL